MCRSCVVGWQRSRGGRTRRSVAVLSFVPTRVNAKSGVGSRRTMEEAMAMSDEDRIARLVAELEELSFEEREPFLAGLSDADRAAVWELELDEHETVDEEELGGGD